MHHDIVKVYGGQGVECVSLNVFGPHKFIGSGTTRKCDFVRVDMVLLEEVYHCGDGRADFEVSYAQDITQ